MFAFLRRLFCKPPVPPKPVIPRVRVADNELNRDNPHWMALIGAEGVFLGSLTDGEGEIWDVQLDSQPIPHKHVMRERFDSV